MTTEAELAEYAERIHMEAELEEWIEHTVIKASLGQMTQSEEAIMEDLEHHGVKGQKWGVRRKSKAPAADIPDVKKLSNEELKTMVARMQLEKQFSDLSRATAPKKHGREFAKGILKELGKEQAKKALKAAPGAIASVAMGAFIARKMVA